MNLDVGFLEHLSVSPLELECGVRHTSLLERIQVPSWVVSPEPGGTGGFSEYLDVSPLPFERGVRRTPTCCTLQLVVGLHHLLR